MDFNKKDRWGCSFFVFIMKYRLMLDLFKKLIQEVDLDVNIKDMYGVIFFYFVVYYNYLEQVELLFEYGVDRNVIDNL